MRQMIRKAASGRASANRALRRWGSDYVFHNEDGSPIIYHDYGEALLDG